MEIWKDIKGHEGAHQISNYGRQRSISRIVKNSLGTAQFCKGRIRENPRIDKYGYKKVALRIGGVRKYYTIHRLVALAFIPNPENKPQINHIDEDKLNNHFSNLEWATAKENVNHNNMPDRRAKNIRKKVVRMDLNGNILKKYDSMKQTKEDGFNPSNVSRCCLNNGKTHRGFKWKYA